MIYLRALCDICDRAIIKGRIYECIGEEMGWYRVIDESGYDEDEEVQGYLFPKGCFEAIAGSCPVCGGPLESDGCFEICRICGWEDDPLNRDLPDYDGINPLSLNEARTAWARGMRIYPNYPNPKEGRKIKKIDPTNSAKRIFRR